MTKAPQSLSSLQFVWPLLTSHGAADAESYAVEVELLSGLNLAGELFKVDSKSKGLWLRDERAHGFRTVQLNRVRQVRLLRTLSLKTLSETSPESKGCAKINDAVEPFLLRYVDGVSLQGELKAYVSSVDGLFLFTLNGSSDDVECLFVPLEQIAAFLPELNANPQGVSMDAAHLGVLRNRPRQHTLHDHASNTVRAHEVTTPKQLLAALREQRGQPRQPLGQALIHHGLINSEQLEKVMQLQAQNPEQKLGELLVSSGAVCTREMQLVLAEKLGMPYVNVEKFQIPPDVLALVSSAMAYRQQILPLMRSEDRLIVAVENPLDFPFEPELRFIVDMNITAVCGDADEIRERITQEYGNWAQAEYTEQTQFNKQSSLVEAHIEELAERLDREAKRSNVPQPVAEPEAHSSDNTLVRLVNKMIVDAHRQGASDIHIEAPAGGNAHIRFRIDGQLRSYLDLQPVYRRALVSRIKVMSNLDISEHRLAQDGKIDFRRFGPAAIHLRVAVIPTQYGAEDVVLRLLDAAAPIPLQELEMGDACLSRLKPMVERHHGLILVCGPTGSGKTTTLHSVMHHINKPERKIWTAEDPIEINQSGLRQVQVNPRIGWTFAKAMRAFLRADPDVIMVGEMRDSETAGTAIEASLTGHLVLSTLHTNSAAESIVRLLEIGMDPYNFADALIGILSQRLARRLCKNCRASRLLLERELAALAQEYCLDTDIDQHGLIQEWKQQYGDGTAVSIFEAKGCDQCDKGYRGRVGVFELLTVTPEIQELIRTQGSVPQIRKSGMSNGMRLLRQDALEKVLKGLLDLPSARAASS